jgi:large subunit ribosomal protein L28
MGGDPARGDPLPLSRAQRKEGRKNEEGDDDRRRALEKRNTAAVVAMASALCTFSLPSSSLSCSNQAGVSSFSSRCSDVLGDGSRPFHQLGCQTELADSTAGIVAQPRASRVCDLTGKKANNGYKVSFSNHRTKTLQGANLQYKRLWWEEGKRFVKLRLSTKALKTVEKKGLQVMAKEAGINLADF